MMGTSHRLLGTLAGVTVASAAGQSVAQVVFSGLIASATSHGWASPDMDQSEPWVAVRRRLPDDVARLLNHRELSHWWVLPVLAGVAVGVLPEDSRWTAVVLLTGWVSHLVGDFVFGELPLWPGGRAVGLGLDTGGFWETGRFEIAGQAHHIPFGPVRVLTVAGTLFLLVRGV